MERHKFIHLSDTMKTCKWSAWASAREQSLTYLHTGALECLLGEIDKSHARDNPVAWNRLEGHNQLDVGT